ncbi:MAG: alpha/beta fold hydrolase [Chloroflexi bacterium]|nr:alpha/beta fold hydrolase [Chloroflexota bacterium]
MLAQPQSSKSLLYVAILPEGYDPSRSYPLVILLHGYGAHMYDLASLAPSIDPRSYVYVCPNGPVPVMIGQGMMGYSWRPPRDDGGPPEAQQEQARRVEGMLGAFFGEVMERYKTPPGRAILIGFSQGGTVTYNLGLARPDLFAGIACLSTGIAEPELVRSRLPAQRAQPVFIAHGLQDNPDRARRSRAFLEEAGYKPEYHEYNMGHEISDEVLRDLAPWVHKLLPVLTLP